MRSLILGLTLGLPLTAQDPGTAVETADGTTLHLESFGDPEGPPVLFVHGGPGFPPLQPPAWLAALAEEGHRVHVLHQRGCGRSARPLDRLPDDEDAARETLRRHYGFAVQLADLDSALDTLELERCALIGHSFGAVLASLYAASHPERVEALALLAPADVFDGALAGKEVFAAIRARTPEAERSAYDAHVAALLDFEHFAGATDADLSRRVDWFGYHYMAALGQEVPRPDAYPFRWSGGLSAFALMAELGERGALWPELEAIEAPTLVLHPGADLVDAAVSEAVAAAIGDAAFAVIPDDGHWFARSADTVAERIATLLAEAN